LTIDATNYARKIENYINQTISTTRVLEILLRDGNGQIRDFPRKAAEVLDSRDSIIATIQLAPNGIVREIFPLAGNERAIGHDLFSDTEYIYDLRRTVQFRTLVLGGPYNSKQGGKVIIARLPVFLDTTQDTQFWGLINTLIFIDKLTEASGLSHLAENGVLFRLLKRTDQGDLLIAGNPEVSFKDAISVEINVPNGEWRLELIPRSGWHNPLIIELGVAIAMVLAMLMGKFVSIFAQQSAMQQKLKYLSDYDGLTGLYNRRKLDESLGRECAQADRIGADLSIILIDIDHFKRINDKLGHAVGDQVLAEIAHRIRDNIRQNDIAGRWGGEEFLVLCPGTDLTGAATLAEKLRDIVARQELVPGVSSTASFGVASYRNGAPTLSLFNQADEALYLAKNGGRNQIQVATVPQPVTV
jgi:diguanylate cyclase (GGDEF)-like protein